jgi:hypothetical protein
MTEDWKDGRPEEWMGVLCLSNLPSIPSFQSLLLILQLLNSCNS